MLCRVQGKVFALLLKCHKIDEEVVRQMRGWRHSGFSAHHGVRLTEGDTAGLDHLAQYLLRCPFSLEHMMQVTDQGKVIYRAEKRACLSARGRKATSPVSARSRAAASRACG